MQQLCEFRVGNRPRAIFAKLHTNEARVKVEWEMSKQFSVLEDVLKFICLTYINQC